MGKKKNKPGKKRDHSKRVHKETSGSGAHRWPRCSGSIFLGREVGPRPDTKPSLRGTDTHELGEVCVNDFLNHKLTGSDPEENYKEEKAFRDEQQIKDVEFYRDYIWFEVMEESVTNKAWGVEDTVEHADCDKRGGEVDFWMVHINDKAERVLHIVDYKNGVDPVDIKHEQFLEYGICFRSMVRAAGKDIDRLIVHCVSPNFLNGVKTQKKSYTPKQMDTKDEWFMKAIHRIYVEKKVQYKPGHWCKWCPGASRCKKNIAKQEQAIGLDLLTTETELPAVDFMSKDCITEEQAIAIALNESKIKAIIKACKAYVIGQHMEGIPLDGCKVVQTKPQRKMPKDTRKLVKALKKAGLKKEDIFTEKIKGVVALDKALGKKKKLLEKYIDYTRPTASVTTEDDPRPAAEDLSNLLMD